MEKHEVEIQDGMKGSDTVKVQVEEIINQVAPDLQKEFPNIEYSKIIKLLEGLLFKKVADKSIDWVLDNLPEIIEKAKEILFWIDSLGP